MRNLQPFCPSDAVITSTFTTNTVEIDAGVHEKLIKLKTLTTLSQKVRTMYEEIFTEDSLRQQHWSNMRIIP